MHQQLRNLAKKRQNLENCLYTSTDTASRRRLGADLHVADEKTQWKRARWGAKGNIPMHQQPSTVNHSPQPAHVADEPRFEPAAAARMPARITTRPLDQLKCSPL